MKEKSPRRRQSVSQGLEAYQREEEARAVGQGRKTGLWRAGWVGGGWGAAGWLGAQEG